jgi:hypothetical protein
MDPSESMYVTRRLSEDSVKEDVIVEGLIPVVPSLVWTNLHT